MDWDAKLRWALDEHERRRSAPRRPGERDDLKLAGVAGASWAAGLAAAMAGLPEESEALLKRAADEYVESWDAAPAGSWGRPIAVLRCRLLADDAVGAAAEARRALTEGAAQADGAIARYCACLALLVLRDDAAAGAAARALREDASFEPAAVADALLAIAGADAAGYALGVEGVLRDFEGRDAFLEDVHVADTVLVLDALARRRGLERPALDSPLLPPA